MDNKQDILALLRQVAGGTATPEQALARLKQEPFEDLGYAKVDYHRSIRQGAAEVVYGAGKTPEQITGILRAMGERGCKNILVTRIEPNTADYISAQLSIEYHKIARIGVAYPGERPRRGSIVVATGGTSDIPVAEEAALTAEFLGSRVERVYDVGVAGIHRLLAHTGVILRASVIVVAAGMEGALASVVGGMADCPVIAVPTSVGYGASFGGWAALLSMLNSCASGVSVVNIDNGFGAGYLANMINHIGEKKR